MLNDILLFMSQHSALVAVIVFAAAAIEYLFPPFWGDTIMLAGCFLAGLDRVAAWQVFAAALAGSVVGALAAFELGRRFGDSSLRLMSRSSRATRLLERAKDWQEAHGGRILAVNRFLPGVRAFFLPLAGASGMRLRTVAVWSTVSNLAYCSLLLGVGLSLGAGGVDIGEMEGRFSSLSLLAAAGAVALVLILTVRHVLLQRRRCSERS